MFQLITSFLYRSNGQLTKSQKPEAKVISAFGSYVSISGDTIDVRYDSDAPKVANILNQVGVQYSGG